MARRILGEIQPPANQHRQGPLVCQACGRSYRRGDGHQCGEHDWTGWPPYEECRQLVSIANGYTTYRWRCYACRAAIKYQTFPGTPEDEWHIDPHPREWSPVEGWKRCWATQP